MKKSKKNSANKSIVSEIKEEFKRHMGTLMEQMRKEVKTVAEGHSTIIRKLEEHDDKFESIDKRFNKVESELHSVKMAVVDNSHGIDKIEKKLDENLNNHEKRITKLEEKVHA